MDTKHTPTPQFKNCNELITYLGECNEDKYDFIVRAVNNHAFMVECLKDVLDDIVHERLNHVDGNASCEDTIREVLKLAEEA